MSELSLKEKTVTVDTTLGYPCYACGYNNRDCQDYPCNECTDNCANENPKRSFYDPILDPK